MSTLDALRQAVLASPDDDLPRLVFADYLEENGDPDRAAFIRAQIELAKTPEYEPFAVLCKTRKEEWVTGQRWLGEVDEPSSRHVGGYPWPFFHRGFVSAVSVNSPRNYRFLEQVAARHPIWALHTGTGTLDQWQHFASLVSLSRIHTFTLTGLTSPNEPLRCLRESPYTTGITSLRLEHTNVASLSVILEDLFKTPLGKQLTSLSMRLGYGQADEWLEAIAAGSDVNLKEYDLYRMGFGPAAARVFADSGLAKQAEVLRLVGNPLMRAGVSILATAADTFRVLDLSETMLDAKASEPLAQSPNFRSLRKLVLTGNKLGTEAIKAVARSPHLAGLRSLGLANTHCDNAAVRYVTRGTIWPNLVELDLRNNPISDVGAKHLVTAPPAPDLTSLLLPTKNITDAMRAELKVKFGGVVSWAD